MTYAHPQKKKDKKIRSSVYDLSVDTAVNANIGSKKYITKNVYDAAIDRRSYAKINMT